MDVTANIDADAGITIAITNMHPVERADAGELIGDLIVRLHRELTHCTDGDA